MFLTHKRTDQKKKKNNELPSDRNSMYRPQHFNPSLINVLLLHALSAISGIPYIQWICNIILYRWFVHITIPTISVSFLCEFITFKFIKQIVLLLAPPQQITIWLINPCNVGKIVIGYQLYWHRKLLPGSHIT